MQVIIAQRRPLVIPGLDSRVAQLQADILTARRQWQALAAELESTADPERCAADTRSDMPRTQTCAMRAAERRVAITSELCYAEGAAIVTLALACPPQEQMSCVGWLVTLR